MATEIPPEPSSFTQQEEPQKFSIADLLIPLLGGAAAAYSPTAARGVGAFSGLYGMQLQRDAQKRSRAYQQAYQALQGRQLDLQERRYATEEQKLNSERAFRESIPGMIDETQTALGNVEAKPLDISEGLDASGRFDITRYGMGIDPEQTQRARMETLNNRRAQLVAGGMSPHEAQALLPDDLAHMSLAEARELQRLRGGPGVTINTPTAGGGNVQSSTQHEARQQFVGSYMDESGRGRATSFNPGTGQYEFGPPAYTEKEDGGIVNHWLNRGSEWTGVDRSGRRIAGYQIDRPQSETKIPSSSFTKWYELKEEYDAVSADPTASAEDIRELKSALDAYTAFFRKTYNQDPYAIASTNEQVARQGISVDVPGGQEVDMSIHRLRDEQKLSREAQDYLARK